MIQIQRLCQKVIGAGFNCLSCVFNASVTGQNDNRNSGVFCRNSANNLLTRNSVHAKVSNYKVNSAFGNQGKTFLSAGSFFYLIAFKLKIVGKSVTDIFFIINRKNSKHVASCVSPPVRAGGVFILKVLYYPEAEEKSG